MDAMNYRVIIFNAAKDGKLERLKIFLDGRPNDWLDNCLNGPSDTTPPLVIAARNGYSDCVKYLIAKGANTSVTGVVTFDGETIQGAPPLWAAAAAGHLETVKALIESGANINQTTSTNSTPLRGACYDGHLEIVRYLVEHGANIEIANRHGHTALMIAAYREKVDVVKYLLEVGADAKRASSKGNTALHDAAEAGSVEVTKLLLEHGARMEKDEYGVTPLMSASILGHAAVIYYFLPYASYRERRDAWKLLGATMVDKRMDLSGATTCWRNSFEYNSLVKLQSGGEDEINPLNEVSRIVYGYHEEVNSEEKLELICTDPEAMRMQALIIRERILGDFHPEVHYYARYRGAVYCDLGRLDLAIDLWLHVLQLQQHYLFPMHPNTLSTFVAFLETFAMVIEDTLINPFEHRLPADRLNLETVLVVYERAVLEFERYLHRDEELHKEQILPGETDINQDLENFRDVLLQFIHLINRVILLDSQPSTSINIHLNDELLTANIPVLNPDSERNINPTNFINKPETQTCLSTVFCSHSVVTRLKERLKLPEKTVYPLRPRCPHLLCNVRRLVQILEHLHLFPVHSACQESDQGEGKHFPSHFVVDRLIRAGADLNVKNSDGNTALHILLSTASPRLSIVKLLLEAGAPLLARNNMGITCFDLMIQKFNGQLQNFEFAKFITLKQIAANFIRWHGIPYKDIIPADIEKYLDVF
uniref:Sex-determining protein fem-1 n=1 Tax=Acrobeloides nanus TaxID=290746 RepID=A0A914DHG1_9BILA